MHKISNGTAMILKLPLQGELMQDKIGEWIGHLDGEELTEEMLRVFIAMGWLTPRDPRVEKNVESEQSFRG
jgi:hypothetical protein